jgi:hypothetical protein
VERHELETHMRKNYSDALKEVPLNNIAGLLWPSKPGEDFKTLPPTLQEIKCIVDKTRNKSAPGPNGIPYIVYKRCPEVLRRLHRLLKHAWIEGYISKEWKKANGVYIPKENNSKTIDQFRPISLLNVEGKIFFAVMAKRLTAYLLKNGYIDTATNGRYPRHARMPQACYNDMGRNSESQIRESKPPFNMVGPCKCIWISNPSNVKPLICTMFHKR